MNLDEALASARANAEQLPSVNEHEQPEGPWIKSFPFMDLGSIQDLNNDERGLFLTIRCYCLTGENGFRTLPADTEEAWKVLGVSAGISRYKFRKVFSALLQKDSRKFEIFQSRIFFSRDLRRFEETAARIAKNKKAGHLGGTEKANRARKEPHQRLASARDQTTTDQIRVDSIQQQQLIPEEDLSAAAVATATETEFPKARACIARSYPDVNGKFMKRLVERARSADPDVTDAVLTDALMNTHKPTQRSAGMWLETVPSWLENQQVLQKIEKEVRTGQDAETAKEWENTVRTQDHAMLVSIFDPDELRKDYARFGRAWPGDTPDTAPEQNGEQVRLDAPASPQEPPAATERMPLRSAEENNQIVRDLAKQLGLDRALHRRAG
jgi:hypothetical protein